MNDITTEVLPPKAPLVAGRRPTAIVPADIDQVWRIATIACESGMAPKDMATPAKATVAILHGLEIGLPPMMALNKIAVINGRPCVWGDAVPAIALATGQVEDWHEEVKGDGDNMLAICTVKRRGIKSSTMKTFSVADAKTAGLWGKAGPWKQYPKRMLAMRARVAFRDLFADALGGLYIAEEMIGVENDDTRAEKARDVTPPKRPPPPEDEPAGERMTEKELLAGLQDLGVGPPPEGGKPPAGATSVPDAALTAAAARRPPPPDDAQTAPPEDPEAFYNLMDTRFKTCQDMDALNLCWQCFVEPIKDRIFPPDLDELANLFGRRQRAIEVEP